MRHLPPVPMPTNSGLLLYLILASAPYPAFCTTVYGYPGFRSCLLPLSAVIIHARSQGIMLAIVADQCRTVNSWNHLTAHACTSYVPLVCADKQTHEDSNDAVLDSLLGDMDDPAPLPSAAGPSRCVCALLSLVCEAEFCGLMRWTVPGEGVDRRLPPGALSTPIVITPIVTTPRYTVTLYSLVLGARSVQPSLTSAIHQM